MGYNDFIKKIKGDNKKAEQEQQIRLKSILEEVNDVVQRRGVTVLEIGDLLLNMLSRTLMQLNGLNRDAFTEIERLKKENNKLKDQLYDFRKQDEANRQENKG